MMNILKRKHKIEVVPESQYTDFSERLEEKSDKATKETIIAATLVPVTTILAFKVLREPSTETAQLIPVSSPIVEPIITPISQLTQTPSLSSIPSNPELVPVGYVADKTLDTLANILDPLVDLIVALAFPIASVMVVCACILLMFNSEKAMGMLMRTGIGYCLISLSPMLLDILRTLGDSVAQK